MDSKTATFKYIVLHVVLIIEKFLKHKEKEKSNNYP